jgi:hypothetical protein
MFFNGRLKKALVLQVPGQVGANSIGTVRNGRWRGKAWCNVRREWSFRIARTWCNAPSCCIACTGYAPDISSRQLLAW